MRKIFFNPEHQKEFMERGLIIVDMLSQEEVDQIIKELAEMRPHDNFAPKDRMSDYHCTFLDTNEEYKRQANALIAKTFQPHIDKFVNAFRILNGNFYIKPPGSGTFEIHQNWTHNNEHKYTTLTVWCPLVDVSKVNGALEFVAGSHKIVPDIATVNVPYYFHNFEQALIDKYLEPVTLKAGQAVIFDDGLIHYSSQNNGEAPRYAIQIETIPVEMTPVFYHFDKDNPAKGFEVFEVDFEFFIKGNFFNMKDRPEHLKSLGFIKNENKLLSERQFVKKMKHGNKVRQKLYEMT